MFFKTIVNQLKNLLLVTLKDPEIYKFLAVGTTNAIILITLTIILTENLNIFYLYSSIISFEITIIIGFFINNFWTFSKKKHSQNIFQRFLKYQIFYIIGLLLNGIILFVLTDYFSLHYLFSQLTSIFCVFLFNFYSSKKITFKN